MSERSGIFSGDDPFALAEAWMAEAAKVEPNDPNAMQLATVDADGLPNVRTVLLKEIEPGGFVFYTNFESAKGQEIDGSAKAAFVIHWKSLRRQIRARGHVEPVSSDQADAYFNSRPLQSRIGAWASDQSRPLASREALIARVAKEGITHGTQPKRPSHWGGFRIIPVEMEFWANGDFRLHDRFRWTRDAASSPWDVKRLHP